MVTERNMKKLLKDALSSGQKAEQALNKYWRKHSAEVSKDPNFIQIARWLQRSEAMVARALDALEEGVEVNGSVPLRRVA